MTAELAGVTCDNDVDGEPCERWVGHEGGCRSGGNEIDAERLAMALSATYQWPVPPPDQYRNVAHHIAKAYRDLR